MVRRHVFSRHVTYKDAELGYVPIPKDQLSFFPPVEAVFELATERVLKGVKVESYPCTCRGRNSTHEHYFVRLDGLEAGDEVEISCDVKRDQYTLQLLRGRSRGITGLTGSSDNLS